MLSGTSSLFFDSHWLLSTFHQNAVQIWDKAPDLPPSALNVFLCDVTFLQHQLSLQCWNRFPNLGGCTVSWGLSWALPHCWKTWLGDALVHWPMGWSKKLLEIFTYICLLTSHLDPWLMLLLNVTAPKCVSSVAWFASGFVLLWFFLLLVVFLWFARIFLLLLALRLMHTTHGPVSISATSWTGTVNLPRFDPSFNFAVPFPWVRTDL